MNIVTEDEKLDLQLVKYRVLGKKYSKWRAIITAGTADSDTMFLFALEKLHGIQINKAKDPMVFISQDTMQMAELKADGIENPTDLQLLLTSRAISLTEGGCKDRMEAILRGMKVEPPSNS